MELELLKRLSRSDKVYLAKNKNGEIVVLKKYNDKNSQKIEMKILDQLAVSGYAPKIIEKGDDYIIYEYLEGMSFAEKFHSYTMLDDEEGLVRLANELSIFLQIFYSLADGYIINDISFSNFIIKDGRCYGVDYDSVANGMQYTDVAKVVAHAVTHAVGNIVSSFPFIKQLLKNFRLDMIDIINDVKLALSESPMIINVDYILNSLMYIDDMKI